MNNKEPIVNAAGVGDNPVQVLQNEHRAVLLKLELMERALQYLQRATENAIPERIEVEKTLLKDLVTVLERGLGLHFQKEEEALFPVLAEYIGKEHGPIEVMLHEHEKIRSVFEAWKKILPVFCEISGPVGVEMLKAVSDSGFEAIHLIRQHIKKENEVLFRICELSLSEDEKRGVMEKMRTIGAGPLEKR